ncbi:uncharacterized protein LOC134229801 [Saccostrea cucullata]|uniref:uncharacterized protein LOC134229801 n=1 Tax=Saccostrea cuccullata TaxID=36930 RepID=UPI002ED52D43
MESSGPSQNSLRTWILQMTLTCSRTTYKKLKKNFQDWHQKPKRNTKITEVMRINNKRETPIQLNGENIKETDRFTYLGSTVNKDGGGDDDVKSRINKARHAFHTLRQIWNFKALSINSKIRIFNTNVKAVLLYGSETWKVTKTINSKLHSFINKCLRHILNIRWPDTISNNSL